MSPNRPVRICIPVCARTVDALASGASKAAESADLIELRLDCLDPTEFEKLNRLSGQLTRGLSRPSIVTFRPAEQGGHCEANYETRSTFWRSWPEKCDSAFFDIEHDLAANFTTTEIDWSRIICSHHDFAGVPSDLEDIHKQMAATPAAILKIAVQARDLTDCLPVFHLLERAAHEGREMIAIAMGNAGIATRVLGPSRGAFLTYGSLETEKATAPGQITARELRSLYHIDKIDEQTLICGLVGLPAMHSVSPHIHNAAFESKNINGVYLPFEVLDLRSFFSRMVHPRTRELNWNLRGLSITAPHKTRVIDFLDWVDPMAMEIGAVNTVVVEADMLRGYNTDAEGMIEPLIAKIGSLEHLRVAVIGAGGAACAAVWSLQSQKANITLFARNSEKGTHLADRFGIPSQALANQSFADYDVVINATPLGSLGSLVDDTPATAEQLAGARLIYDLVYNPIETSFLGEARRAGCETLGGLEMLVAQAARQFQLWTGIAADSSVMHKAGRKALKENS